MDKFICLCFDFSSQCFLFNLEIPLFVLMAKEIPFVAIIFTLITLITGSLWENLHGEHIGSGMQGLLHF